jgi:hypothetical protein
LVVAATPVSLGRGHSTAATLIPVGHGHGMAAVASSTATSGSRDFTEGCGGGMTVAARVPRSITDILSLTAWDPRHDFHSCRNLDRCFCYLENQTTLKKQMESRMNNANNCREGELMLMLVMTNDLNTCWCSLNILVMTDFSAISGLVAPAPGKISAYGLLDCRLIFVYAA